MTVLVLALLLIAALLGILTQVVQAALVLALSIVLAVVMLVALGLSVIRYRVWRFRRDVERRFGGARRSLRS
ncbi:MAG TPA: hypothetical protein VJN50_00715 [Actinomycetota bacterium]|nr:hypothetical protein [Actinomycetota bacterium]